ncbi:hypothetical protein [Achromobacter aloeverae]|nr:hypothetical protein [Achromobacter aloeverae]
MSYDSLRMLEEARSHVYGGIYPAMPVYLMRLSDITGHGPTVMLVVQNFLIFLGLAIILRFLAAPWWFAVMVMALILSMPVVVGPMLVVWKDVTTTAPMLMALVLIYWARRHPSSPRAPAAKWCSMLLLIVASLVRFNAVTATAVIAVYWVLSFYSGRSRLKQVAIFLLALAAMAACNKVVNGYSFPRFQKLAGNDLAYGIMNYDLVGISKWSGTPLVPVAPASDPLFPKATITDISRIYNSLGALHIQAANEALGNPVKLAAPGYSNNDIAHAWIDAILRYPAAYLRYRRDLFEEIIGAKPTPTFEPTHYGKIDDNNLGMKFTDRAITGQVLTYIENASTVTLGKPWPYLLLSIGCTAIMLGLRTIPGHLRALGGVAFCAAIMYIVPFFAMTGTGEVRYVYPTLILGSVPILVLLLGWRSRAGIAQ